MDPMSRRLVASVLFAVVAFLWMFAGSLNPISSGDDVIMVLVTLLILAVIGYRAWPAVEILWDLWRTPEWQFFLSPTRQRVVGAAALSALVILLRLGFYQSLSIPVEVDGPSVVQTFLVLAVLGYLVWPVLALKWRRLRST